MNLIRNAFGLAYFVVWALLYYCSKLRAYSHYSALLVPIIMLIAQIILEYYWAENMKSYDPSQEKSWLDKMVLFFLLFNWCSVKPTLLVGTAAQIATYYIILKKHADQLAETSGDTEADPLKYSMYNSLVYVAAAFMLHYVKMKSVVSLLIENGLTKRQNLTTLEYFNGSTQAILLVKKGQNQKSKVTFQNE